MHNSFFILNLTFEHTKNESHLFFYSLFKKKWMVKFLNREGDCELWPYFHEEWMGAHTHTHTLTQKEQYNNKQKSSLDLFIM